jgi:hypothetical protein
MKKTIIAALLLIATTASAQTDDPVWNYENRVNLQSKGKVELANLYMLEIENLMHNCYLMPLFDTLPNIPTTKKNNKAFSNMIISTSLHIDEIYENMSTILPYADKDHLVEAIIQMSIINSTVTKFQKQVQSNIKTQK